MPHRVASANATCSTRETCCSDSTKQDTLNGISNSHKRQEIVQIKTDVSKVKATTTYRRRESVLKIKTQTESLAHAAAWYETLLLDAPSCNNKKRTSESKAKHHDRKRSVQFSTLTVFAFRQTLGDNPSIRGGGAPVCLDYSHPPVRVGTFAVDDFEQRRPPRQSLEVLGYTKQQRTERLDEEGISKSDIRSCAKRVAKVHRQRARSRWWDHTIGMETEAERLEMICKAIRNATISRTLKQKERDLLEPYYIKSI